MQQSLHGNLMLMLQQGASNVDKTQARYNIRTLPWNMVILNPYIMSKSVFLFLICVGGYCALCLFVNVILCCVVCDGFACLWEGTVIGVNPVYVLCFILFLAFDFLSILRGHSFFSTPPQRPMTSDFERFSIPDFIHYIYFPILILEKESQYFPFLTLSELLVPFLWRGPWLGIEPGTYRTRSQH